MRLNTIRDTNVVDISLSVQELGLINAALSRAITPTSRQLRGRTSPSQLLDLVVEINTLTREVPGAPDASLRWSAGLEFSDRADYIEDLVHV